MILFRSSQPFRFLDLPIELRVRIYEILFFEDVDEPASIRPWIRPGNPSPEFNTQTFMHETQLAVHTAPRQIHLCPGFRFSDYEQHPLGSLERFPLAILRVCRRIQAEAEVVFYGSLSINLMTGQFGKRIASWEWLAHLPRKYRRLIRRVEHFCYNSNSVSNVSRSGDVGYSLFDWSVFTSILAKECLALQSLKLWVYSDQQEHDWLACASEEDSWVKALLQLELSQNLREFEMPGIQSLHIQESEHRHASLLWPMSGLKNQLHRSYLQYHPSSKPIQSSLAKNLSTVRLLKARLECTSHRNALINGPQASAGVVPSFPIFKLPLAIRARIYRYILLPSSKMLHPYIGSWYDETTRNTVPLLLTSRKIRKEAEEVLYGEAVFAIPEVSRLDMVVALRRFFEKLVPRLRAKIRHVHIDELGWHHGMHFLKYLLEETLVRNLTCSLSRSESRILDYAIRHPKTTLLYGRGRRIKLSDFEDVFKRFQTVNLLTGDPDDVHHLSKIRDWLASLPTKWMLIDKRRKSLRSRNSTATISA